jgi:trehalose 2-sulfotransferase
MLDHIDTGYEGKFDFPAREQPPDKTYLLATVPRAGSTHFSHVLWQTGCLGAPLEYLNFEPAGPYGFAANSPEAQLDLWRTVLRLRCSPNGVFGLKAFPMQLQALDGDNPALLQQVLATMLPRGGPRHIVYLRRRDLVAQAVSYARAVMSGIWRKEQEAREPNSIDYSQEQLESAERGILFQQNVWGRMFNDLRIDPLCIWHEDVLADPAAAARQVADYIGVAVDPASAVHIPQIHKQSRGDAEAWMGRYSQSRG